MLFGKLIYKKKIQKYIFIYKTERQIVQSTTDRIYDLIKISVIRQYIKLYSIRPPVCVQCSECIHRRTH